MSLSKQSRYVRSCWCNCLKPSPNLFRFCLPCHFCNPCILRLFFRRSIGRKNRECLWWFYPRHKHGFVCPWTGGYRLSTAYSSCLRNLPPWAQCLCCCLRLPHRQIRPANRSSAVLMPPIRSNRLRILILYRFWNCSKAQNSIGRQSYSRKDTRFRP